MHWLILRKNLVAYLFLVPFFSLFLLFFIIPVIWGFALSLTSYDLVNPMKWQGLSNYINLFTNDDLFILALKNTLYFSFWSGLLGFFSSFFLPG